MKNFETDFIDLVKCYGFTYDMDETRIDVYFNGEPFTSLDRLTGLIHTFTDFKISFGELCIDLKEKKIYNTKTL